MKIATFNVNGVNGRLPVLMGWLAEADVAADRKHKSGALTSRLGRKERLELKLPRLRRVVLDLGDYGSVVTASIAAS